MRGRKSNCDSKSQSGLSLLLPPCMWRETRRALLSTRVKGVAMHALISEQMREEGTKQKKKKKKKKKNMERKMRLEPQYGARRIPATTRVRTLNKGF